MGLGTLGEKSRKELYRIMVHLALLLGLIGQFQLQPLSESFIRFLGPLQAADRSFPKHAPQRGSLPTSVAFLLQETDYYFSFLDSSVSKLCLCRMFLIKAPVSIHHTVMIINRGRPEINRRKSNSWRLQWVNLAIQLNEIVSKQCCHWEYSVSVISPERSCSIRTAYFRNARDLQRADRISFTTMGSQPTYDSENCWNRGRKGCGELGRLECSSCDVLPGYNNPG